jgi:YHS domain-containing protein
MTTEECPSCREEIAGCLYCGEQITVSDELEPFERKVGGKTFKFCSEACADAYKEVKRKREDLTEQESSYPLIVPFVR